MCCVVFLADGSCKILFSYSTGAESKTVEEEKKAVYQIRRPLGLVFFIFFCWLGELLPFYIQMDSNMSLLVPVT